MKERELGISGFLIAVWPEYIQWGCSCLISGEDPPRIETAGIIGENVAFTTVSLSEDLMALARILN
jgi:hypothetical protein